MELTRYLIKVRSLKPEDNIQCYSCSRIARSLIMPRFEIIEIDAEPVCYLHKAELIAIMALWVADAMEEAKDAGFLVD
jgi:hypothetical protein